MSLFKISRGGYADLPNDLTDGWAYFTPDNKGFYIDVVNTVNDTVYNERIKINDRANIHEYILTPSGWINKTYTLGVPEGYDNGAYLIEIDVTPVGNVSRRFAITSAAAKANIEYDTHLEGSQILIKCNGTLPIMSIPIKVKFIPFELT